MINWRACFVQESTTTEEHACEFNEILIDDQESLSTVFFFFYFWKEGGIQLSK